MSIYAMGKQCKNRFILCISILLTAYTIIAADSPCGDWEPYKEEKCFKIFNNAGLKSYDDAMKTCHQQDNSSTLISIRFLEEQEFITNFLKTKKIADNVWIGVNYTNNKYKWNDNSDLIFTNWEKGSPKNKTDHCVQLQSDEVSFGKWSDVLCNKGNLVVCQKMQTWSLSHLQEVLLNTIKNPFPIGFIYVQLPNEKYPSEIWPWMFWQDISTAYAGVFFRVTGGGASTIGQVQEENSPRLVRVVRGNKNCNYDIINVLSNGQPSDTMDVAPTKYCDQGIQFIVSTGEVRPRNMAIRVWKRTG